MKKVENVIYILTTPQYPGYIKIGYASDLKSRVASLNTSMLLEFKPYAVYETPIENGDRIIHNIIKLLNPILRVSTFTDGKEKYKEFFKLSPEQGFLLLKYIANVSGTGSHAYRVSEDFKPIQEDVTESEETPNSNTVEVIKQPSTKTIKPKIEATEFSQIVPNGTYTLNRKIKNWDNKNVNATIIVNGKDWILQPGSIICPVFSCENSNVMNRVTKRRTGIKIVNNILKEPVIFDSPSEAACFCVGMETNGWKNWKTLNGEIIDIYRH